MGSAAFFTDTRTRWPRWRFASVCHMLFCTSSKAPVDRAGAADRRAVMVPRPGTTMPGGCVGAGRGGGAPIGRAAAAGGIAPGSGAEAGDPALAPLRSEEHTSELQSLAYLVC